MVHTVIWIGIKAFRATLKKFMTPPTNKKIPMSLPIEIQSLLYLDYLYIVSNMIVSIAYSFNAITWLYYTAAAFVWNFPTIFVWYVGTETSAKSWEPLFYYRIVKIVIEGGWWIYMITECIIHLVNGGSGYLFGYTTWTL